MQTDIKTSEQYAELVSDTHRAIANEGKKTVCKDRGIILNYHTKQLITFDVIRVMNLEQEGPFVNVHTEHKIKRQM